MSRAEQLNTKHYDLKFLTSRGFTHTKSAQFKTFYLTKCFLFLQLVDDTILKRYTGKKCLFPLLYI